MLASLSLPLEGSGENFCGTQAFRAEKGRLHVDVEPSPTFDLVEIPEYVVE
jgi:hypothetical protein